MRRRRATPLVAAALLAAAAAVEYVGFDQNIPFVVSWSRAKRVVTLYRATGAITGARNECVSPLAIDLHSDKVASSSTVGIASEGQFAAVHTRCLCAPQCYSYVPRRLDGRHLTSIAMLAPGGRIRLVVRWSPVLALSRGVVPPEAKFRPDDMRDSGVCGKSGRRDYCNCVRVPFTLFIIMHILFAVLVPKSADASTANENCSELMIIWAA
jgi:hypothetical protein